MGFFILGALRDQILHFVGFWQNFLPLTCSLAKYFISSNAEKKSVKLLDVSQFTCTRALKFVFSMFDIL